MTTGATQTLASMAPMPDARPRRRGQAPQPLSGAPQAQGLTAATVVAAPSKVPVVARHPYNSIGATAPIGSSTTLRNYTSLTDVTLGNAGDLVRTEVCRT
jgi:hypothetical protein